MLRDVSPLLLLTLAATPALAQRTVPDQRMYPITSPVRHAGTVDVTTGRWTRGGAATKLGSQVIYDNTCTWAVAAYYAGFDWCEDVYDEGRVPSPSDPNAPNGAEVTNSIQSFEVSYCTFGGPTVSTGGYDMDVAFWNKLGGDCAGTVPPTPPPVSATATAYFPLAGLGLPGSTTLGFQACWVVTLDVSNSGFVLASDGEGTFDGVGADDKFIWMQRQNATISSPLAGLPDGFFIAGDPAVGGYGACTFDIPCGSGPLGTPCGTGLDTFDAYWVNVDGVGVGSSGQPAGCPNSVAQYGYGTNCYFFGGYPSNPLSSLYLSIDSDGRSGVGVTYCAQSKVTSVAGCSATFSVSDASLASGLWSSTDIPRHPVIGAGPVVGIYLYTSGVGSGQSTFSANTPFGTLCLQGTARSGPAVLPVPQSGVCNTGTMQVAPAGLTSPAVQVGQDINAQLWYRDPLPGNAGNANFSNAVFYTLQ